MRTRSGVVRDAWRALTRRPTLALTLILIFTIAIGLNAAVFSVFDVVLVRPLSYPDADRLLWLSTVAEDGEPGVVTGPEFHDWRAGAMSLDRMVAYGLWDESISAPGGLARVSVASVTPEFWALSGAVPAAGRLPLDDEPGVLVTQAFVARHFASDALVVGTPTTLDGSPVTIIGVLPEGFRPQLPRSPFPGARPGEVDVYRPLSVSSARSGPVQLLNVIARLRPGATVAGARTEIETIRRRAAEAQAGSFHETRTLRVVPLDAQVAGGARLALPVLLAAAALVLVIACANAATLLLAGMAGRGAEMAIRVSLGASRVRVFAQMLVESLLLVGTAGVLGLVVARLTLASIRIIDPHAVPRLAEVALDGRVIGAVMVLSLMIAVVCGLVPAMAVWRTDVCQTLKRGFDTTPARGVRTAGVLVAVQVALAVLLTVGAGLMVKTVWVLTQYPPGFAPDRILTAHLVFSGPGPSESSRMRTFAETLLGRLGGERWVEAATISGHGYSLTRALDVEGRARQADPHDVRPPILINSTTAALPRVLGLQVVRGRWFADQEAGAVLNESVALREFAGQDPLGRRVRMSDEGPWLTIVGICADRKFSRLDAPAEPEVYVPYDLAGDGLFGFTALVLTRGGDPLAHAATFRGLAIGVDAGLVPDHLMTLERSLSQSIAPRRLNQLLFGAFAAAALILAVVAVYGAMSHAVSRRVREIGVRLAVGARPRQVVALVLGRGLVVVSGGVVAGTALGLGLGRVMQDLLYEVQPTDPPTLGAAVLGVALVALIACAIPSARAARVDPVVALRHE